MPAGHPTADDLGVSSEPPSEFFSEHKEEDEEEEVPQVRLFL